MRKQKKQISKYTADFKWQVVQAVLSGKFSKEEARVAYGIKSNCAILDWMRKFSGSDDFSYTHTMADNLAAIQNSKHSKALTERIKQLEEELRRANLRADLWHTMIEVAEQQLGIDIKKKYGAQPSKRSNEARRRQK